MKTKLFASLVVLAMLLATVGVAAAAPAEALKDKGIAGDVIAINGSSLTIQTLKRGSIKVQTDASTRFHAQDNPNASLSDVHVGDRIVARGKLTNEVLHAIVVNIVPADLHDLVAGKVQSISGVTLLVTQRAGSTVTVVTSADTKFRTKDVHDASLSDVKTGDLVEAAGILAGNTLTAGVVRFNTPKTGTGPIAMGKIVSINSSVLTLQTPALDTLTVNLSSKTFIVKRGEGGASVGSTSDLAQGAGIMVIGTRSSDGTSINALAILIRGQRGPKQNGQPQSGGPSQSSVGQRF